MVAIAEKKKNMGKNSDDVNRTNESEEAFPRGAKEDYEEEDEEEDDFEDDEEGNARRKRKERTAFSE